jgi:hypothetical protein
MMTMEREEEGGKKTTVVGQSRTLREGQEKRW